MFSLSYAPWRDGEGWGRMVLKAEPVKVNTEALMALLSQGTQTLAQGATSKNSKKIISFEVDGLAYEATLVHTDVRGARDFSCFFILEGSEAVSHIAVFNDAVWVEIWKFPGNALMHRSIVTRGGRQYLVEWNEDQVDKSLAGDNSKVWGRAGQYRQFEPTSQGKKRSVRIGPPSPCPAGQAQFLESDVVYGYDKTVLNWYLPSTGEKAKAEFRVLAQATVDAYNAAVANSKGGNYRFKLAGIEPMLHYTSSGSILKDLNWLLNDPEIRKLPAKYGSYIYIGLWVGAWDSALGGLAAGGYTGKPGAFPPRHVIYMGGGVRVGVHELAHNVGKNHQKEDPGVPQITRPVLYAYGYARNGYWKDAVSIHIPGQCPNGCPTGPFFSNQSVNLDGVPTGDEWSRNFTTDAVVFKAVAARKICK